MTKEECLKMINELARARLVNGRLIAVNKKLRSRFELRLAELWEAVKDLPPNERAWLEKESNKILIELKNEYFPDI